MWKINGVYTADEAAVQVKNEIAWRMATNK